MRKSTPCLMFYGDAEAAMNLYTAIIPDTYIKSIERYGDFIPGMGGKTMLATLSVRGCDYIFIDSPEAHEYPQSPASSIHLQCGLDEIEEIYEKIAEGGEILMVLDDYGFCDRYAWVKDRYGLSWQLVAEDNRSRFDESRYMQEMYKAQK